MINFNPALTGFQRLQSPQAKMVRFRGKDEQAAFIEKLKGFPAETQERLEQVYKMGGKPAHIELAHSLGEEDDNVKWFNETIADKSQTNDLRTAVIKVMRERQKEKGQAQQLDVDA